MKVVKVVAAAIVQDGKVLATQRGYGEFEGGWEFPGGKVEPGETPEAALVREIREELNARIAVERLLTTVEYDYATFHLSMEVYLCRHVDERLELCEHHAARWVDGSTIDELAWLPADAAVVEQLKRQGVVDIPAQPAGRRPHD